MTKQRSKKERQLRKGIHYQIYHYGFEKPPKYHLSQGKNIRRLKETKVKFRKIMK
jgi:hypothetical protein